MAIIPVEKIRKLGTGIVHSECVAVDSDGFVYGCGRNGAVYRVDPEGGVETIAKLPEGSMPNGFALDRQGNIFYCCLGKKAIMRVTPGGEVSLFADRAGSLPLSTPNYCSFDAEGNLYVSISSTVLGIAEISAEIVNPKPHGALIRLRPDGRGEVVAEGLFMANGTAIGPDEEAVFVLQSATRDCVRFPVRKDGTVGKGEIYSRNFPSIPDGMAFDVEGNLYVTGVAREADEGYEGPMAEIGHMAANQILKVDPEGAWQMLIEDPKSTKLDFPTNCAFGGPDMRTFYMANLEGDHFSCVDLDIPGHPLYHMR